MSTVSKVSRKSYENLEELKIIQWIIRQNRYSEIGGIKLWKDLEFSNEVPGRSYHSMKERLNSTPHYLIIRLCQNLVLL